MLSFAEEIYLLALDDVTGKVVIPSKEVVLNSALIGAVLGELSFMGKIDNDAEDIQVLDTTPTAKPVLDFALESLKRFQTESIPIPDVLNALSRDSKKIEAMVLEQLLEKSILKKVEERILWVIPSRRYPIIDDKEVKDVERRLRDLVLGDDLPDPRDTVLVCLAHACDLFRQILSPREFQRAEERVEAIAKMDIVSQNVMRLISLNLFKQELKNAD